MGRPRKTATTATTTSATGRVVVKAGVKIDRRKKEFRNLPKPKKRKPNYGPPSHILKATIDPKFEEMRQRRQQQQQQQQQQQPTSSNNNGTEDDEEFAAGVLERKRMMMMMDPKEEELKTTRKEEEEEDVSEDARREADAMRIKISGGMHEEDAKNTTTTTTTTTEEANHARPGTPKETTKYEETKREDDEASRAQARKREAIRKEEEEIERQKKDDAKWRPVCLSKQTMAKGIELMDDGRMMASSQNGYRCVQGTRGVEPAVVCEEELKEDGKTQTTATARYFEVKIEHLGENGCVRVGWMTKRGEMNAPVGFDNKGYGYHAETGLKYHEARLKKYGEPYGEGDVIGCYMYLDEKIVKKKEDSTAELKENGDGGDIDSNAVADDEAKKKPPSTPERGASANNKKNRKEERLKAKALEEKEIPPNEGKIVFYKNGQCQGIAFESLRSCVHPKKPELSGYFPTAALYTTPLQDQAQRARVSFNFGPDFAFPIDPEKDGLPKCRGLSPDLDPPKPPPEKIEEEEAVAPLGSGEGATKPEEEKKERKQSTSRSEDERGSPRARSKDEACGVYEKQTKREENKENSVKEEDVDAVMEEEKDEEKVNAASEKVEEEKEAPAEVKEGEVQEFGILSDAIKPACFSRGGKDEPEHARGLDAYVEANTFPVQIKPEVPAKEDEDDVEAKEQSRADELVPTRDDMQHFYENGEPLDADDDGTNIAANNNDEDGTIGYNWLSG